MGVGVGVGVGRWDRAGAGAGAAEQLVMKHDFNSNRICVFDVSSFERHYEAASLVARFNELVSLCQVEGELVLSGGIAEGSFDTNFEASRLNYCYSPVRQEARAIEELLLGRVAHCVVAFSRQQLFFMGGFLYQRAGFSSITNKCESNVAGKLTAMPSLVRGRAKAGGCAFEGRAIFLFCGKGEPEALKSIEYLNTKNLERGWKKFPFEQKGERTLWLERTGLAAIQLDSNRILVFGRLKNEYKCQEHATFTLHVRKKEMRLISDSQIVTNGYQNPVARLSDGHIYTLTFTKHPSLYQFNADEERWRFWKLSD